MNYNNKKFRPISSSENGETDSTTVFHYLQIDQILSCEYQSKNILKGSLLGLVDKEGQIQMSYQQVNKAGQLMTGICKSKPETMQNGKIRLYETWQWTSGDKSKGESILEEI